MQNNDLTTQVFDTMTRLIHDHSGAGEEVVSRIYLTVLTLSASMGNAGLARSKELFDEAWALTNATMKGGN